ncbi:MAG: HAD family hydrolase [Bacteroidetes bacterium]|nr:MAG: HAD family hydrolase [Bacteroidota bacterium]
MIKQNLNRKHQLVLFDIDGTILIYRKYFSKQVFISIIKEIFGKDISSTQLPSFAGMTDLQILKNICSEINISESELNNLLPELWKKLLNEFKKLSNPDCIELLPGVSELINLLDEDDMIQLGLLTGNFRENAYLKLSVFDLDDYFPFGAFGCESDNRNNLPEIAIERANIFANKMSFSTANTIIIGDSPKDIECAKSNNMHILSVATGSFTKNQLSEYDPDIIFENLSDYYNVFNTIINF